MKKDILIIEDEPLIRKSLEKLIRLKGVHVDSESSGKKAIELIMNNSYDRIICDLMLQDTTGFEVIEESKRKYELDEISNIFIIITAYSSTQVLEKAKKYGCNIVEKPFSDIHATIDQFLA